MFTKSLWNEFAAVREYPVLQSDLKVDVAIIGGGITGISTASLLSERGLTVTVLEARKVGGGTSSHSTGNLYTTVDKNLHHLYKKYDSNIVREVIATRTDALDQIESWVEKYNLDCDFKEVPWILYSASKENDRLIEQEWDAAVKSDLSAERLPVSSLPLAATSAMKLRGQAQVNPMRYVQELAAATASEKCQIYEHTRVKAVEEDNEHIHLSTIGGRVTATYAVHATHIPKGIMAVQMALSMYREYGVAFRADNQEFPEGIFWGYHDEGDKYSSRLYERGGERYIMVIGQPHRVGQAEDNVRCIKTLEEFGRHQYGLTDVGYRWGGQNYQPADALPYIGRKSKNSNIFIATGFSTDGLIYGTLSGMIIADEITGIYNPRVSLFNAHRFRPVKSARNLLKEGVNTAVQFVRNIPGVADKKDYAEIPSGEGAVIDNGRSKIAAFKTEEGQMVLHSAVCPHMGCIVNWNNAEQSWDCPCHASRFDTDGNVLEGPSFEPLEKL